MVDRTKFYTDDYNSDDETTEDGEKYFDFTWHGRPNDDDEDSNDGTIAKILALKETSITNPRKFRILSPQVWDASFLRGLIEVCSYFKSNGIIWESLDLDVFDTDQSWDRAQGELVSCFLYHVNTLKLFKNFNLYLEDNLIMGEREGEDEDEEADIVDHEASEKEFVLSGILHNDRVEKVEVWCNVMTTGDIRVLSTLLKTTKTLKQLSLTLMGRQFNDYDISNVIVQGLSENTTLKRVSFVTDRGVSDCAVSNMITALSRHPSLEEMVLHNFDDDDDMPPKLEMTSRAIRFLLSTSKTLSVLTIHEYGDGFNSQQVLQGLKECRCPLKLIDIGGMLNDKLDSILFWSHPTLERIAFQQYAGSSMDSKNLVCATRVKERRAKPIALKISQGFIVRHCDVFMELLHNHPEIRPDTYNESRVTIDSSFLCKFHLESNNLTEREKLKHACDFNWFGRYLLDTTKTAVPLSIWSLVLAKSTSRPSVIFEFLKRQVLLNHIIKSVQDGNDVASKAKRPINDIDGNDNGGQEDIVEEPPRRKRCLRMKSSDTKRDDEKTNWNDFSKYL